MNDIIDTKFAAIVADWRKEGQTWEWIAGWFSCPECDSLIRPSKAKKQINSKTGEEELVYDGTFFCFDNLHKISNINKRVWHDGAMSQYKILRSEAL